MRSYREGRFIGDSRIEKAIEQGSQKGLDAHQILWVQEEFRQMKHLYEHGVKVPKAIAVNGISLVMEFIGDENGNPAPRISDLKMEKDEAEEAFRQSVQNLKLIVRSGRVHGDYSTFNILWHNEKAVVIDFPQVIEFKNNPNANAFLERDVRSLCKSFLKQGVKADEGKVLREVRSRLKGENMNPSNPKSDFVNVNGIRLHYLDWGGKGPALIFLTGMGCSAYIFNKFAPRFTNKFRVLALTRRGQGDSDYPETGYDADTLTEDIRQFMDHLECRKSHPCRSLAGRS